MREWGPSGPFEEALGAAHATGELAICLGLLRDADFALPMSPAAAAGREPVAWPTVADGERTWIVACTSAEALRAVSGDLTGGFRVVSLVELAAGWPDPRLGLAINPGLPVNFFLEPGTVARLAVPSPAEERLAEPGTGPLIVQKPLRPGDLYTYLAEGGSRVSGYCHNARDVAHIATPAVLVDALGLPAGDGLLTGEGSVNILRWCAAGTNLYRPPYGGTDEESMAAVAGWVIEEPPFVGMGLAPNVDQVIREYKIAGVGLPHGAEIWELTMSGSEHRRAVYDGDLERWLLVRLVPPGEPSAPGTRGEDVPEGGGPGAVPQAPQRRHSYRARLGGVEYEASPDQRPDHLWMRLRSCVPAGGFQEVAPRRFVREVPAEECEEVVFVTMAGEWRGAPCQVHDARDGEVLVEYTGGLLPVARRLGMERVERGVHRRWVPRHEVRGLREHAVPLVGWRSRYST